MITRDFLTGAGTTRRVTDRAYCITSWVDVSLFFRTVLSSLHPNPSSRPASLTSS